ncbi:MAG: RusA family crossover junction endodeoxyribonuclease [Selenomonadaceae bacterium]|nr:RusA family crossover junction endodeoxyribonuclease [Selenomonadaceae bacterium]MBR3050084.1 RusA family crossover junction endodeoxyribonuclease [Selenomonadaceae bacterium]
MSSIKFSADIKPVTFKRPGTNRKHRYDPKEYAAFKTALGYVARRAMQGRAPLDCPLKFTAKIFNARPPASLNFGDWDNHAKSICDALNGICFTDDRQIVEGHVYLFKGEPQIEISLEELKC